MYVSNHIQQSIRMVWPCTYLVRVGIELVIVTVVIVMKMTWHVPCCQAVNESVKLHACNVLHHGSCMLLVVIGKVACCCHGYAIGH